MDKPKLLDEKPSGNEANSDKCADGGGGCIPTGESSPEVGQAGKPSRKPSACRSEHYRWRAITRTRSPRAEREADRETWTGEAAEIRYKPARRWRFALPDFRDERAREKWPSGESD